MTERRATTLAVITWLIVFFELLTGCATAQTKPNLWDVCRRACEATGGNVAAVVGPVGEDRPGCLCARREAT